MQAQERVQADLQLARSEAATAMEANTQLHGQLSEAQAIAAGLQADLTVAASEQQRLKAAHTATEADLTQAQLLSWLQHQTMNGICCRECHMLSTAALMPKIRTTAC